MILIPNSEVAILQSFGGFLLICQYLNQIETNMQKGSLNILFKCYNYVTQIVDDKIKCMHTDALLIF